MSPAGEGEGDGEREEQPARPDPVLARREQIARLVSLGQRIGFVLYGIALIAFVVGLVRRDFSGGVALVIQWCLIIGSVVLAPSIVFSYAVKAANRADREGDWR